VTAMRLPVFAGLMILVATWGNGVGQAAAQPARGPTAQPAPAAAARAPAAQVQFRCPGAGIVVTTRSATAVTEWTSQGADPGDPTLCNRKQGFFKTEQRYFGLFDPGAIAFNVPELKQGMQGIIAGTQTEFSLRYEINRGTERWSFVEKWTKIETESMIFDGKTVSVIVLEQNQQNFTRPFVGTARWWLDPAGGLGMKRVVVSTNPNYPWGENWEVIKIVSP
jgi:hypothetical protein